MNTNTQFSAVLKRVGVTTPRRVLDAARYAVEEMERSVVEGSELTGAPGQPVDTGNLFGSWQVTRPSKYEWLLSTNVEYAEYIEHGGNDVAAFTLRSEVGGWHSVKLTEASWDRLVAFAALKARGVSAFE